MFPKRSRCAGTAFPLILAATGKVTRMPGQQKEKSTRNEVLRFIKVKGRVVIEDISRALGITPMAVRRHIRRLHLAGFVQIEKAQRGRGRPAHLVLLTDLGDGLFPKAYDRFSADLIRGVASLDGNAKVEQLFETRKSHLLQKYAGRMDGKNGSARVREAVRILSEEGYMAECSPLNRGTFRITEHNCAIAHIAREYPQVCESELCFLAEMLGADVQRDAHVLKGDSECSYLVQFPSRRKVAAQGR